MSKDGRKMSPMHVTLKVGVPVNIGLRLFCKDSGNATTAILLILVIL